MSTSVNPEDGLAELQARAADMTKEPKQFKVPTPGDFDDTPEEASDPRLKVNLK